MNIGGPWLLADGWHSSETGVKALDCRHGDSPFHDLPTNDTEHWPGVRFRAYLNLSITVSLCIFKFPSSKEEKTSKPQNKLRDLISRVG